MTCWQVVGFNGQWIMASPARAAWYATQGVPGIVRLAHENSLGERATYRQ